MNENWISVEEKLPLYRWKVMFAAKSKDGFWLHYGERTYTNGEGEWFVAENGLKFNTVTHWMQIYPPQESSKSAAD